jgi:hypothetical protein
MNTPTTTKTAPLRPAAPATDKSEDERRADEAKKEQFKKALAWRRRQEDRAATLAQIAAPFAAAGLGDEEALSRAHQLLQTSEREVYEENQDIKDEFDSQESLTKSEVKARMRLSSDKRLGHYADQIGKKGVLRRGGHGERIFSEHDVEKMLAIQRLPKNGQGPRRKT